MCFVGTITLFLFSSNHDTTCLDVTPGVMNDENVSSGKNLKLEIAQFYSTWCEACIWSRDTPGPISRHLRAQNTDLGLNIQSRIK